MRPSKGGSAAGLGAQRPTGRERASQSGPTPGQQGQAERCHDPDGEFVEVQDISGPLRSSVRNPESRPLDGDERLIFYGLSHESLPLEVVTEDGEVSIEIDVEGIRLGQQRSS